VPEYDEASLIVSLAALPAASRLAFGAACAQRLLSGYGGRNKARLRLALDVVWVAALHPTAVPPDSRHIAEEIEWLVPQDTDPGYDPLEDDTTAAVAYAVRALASGDPQEIAWAARRAYGFADYLAESSEAVGIAAVEVELGRQARDLEQLHASASVISAVRARAVQERVGR
jgi:hypothetical protein